MRSLILTSILLSVLHGTSASFIDELDIGVLIGIAVGAGVLLIVLVVLTCFCFGCACFATSKALQKNSPAQGHGPGQKRSPPKSLESAQPQRSQQQQYLPPQQPLAQNSLGNQNQRSSSQYLPALAQNHNANHQQTESEHGNRPQLNGYPLQQENFSPSPQSQRYPQSPQPDMQGNNYTSPLNFEKNPQHSQLQQPGSHSPSPQPHNYPQSPPPLNYPQSPQSFNEGYPTSPHEQYQHQYGKDYPISHEQYQNTPITSRVVPGFRYPEGLIEELRTDGNTKLKPPPPPKPIKLISQVKEDVPPPDY